MTDALYLTQAEAAKSLRLSQRTLERLRVAGTGPCFIRAGQRRILYRSTALESWADARTFRSTSEADAATVNANG